MVLRKPAEVPAAAVLPTATAMGALWPMKTVIWRMSVTSTRMRMDKTESGTWLWIKFLMTKVSALPAVDKQWPKNHGHIIYAILIVE